MAANDGLAQDLKRSSFLVVDTSFVGPNLDILHRYRLDDRGRPIRDPLGALQELDDDDSVDPKVNYATGNQVDMFEDFDAGALDALTQMQQGISSRGFRLLAYIIVNFLCEAVKCPRSIDAIRARHQDIFTWLPIRHLAYTIVLLKHSVNR